MMRILVAAALLLLPSVVSAEQNEPFKPGLGEIMTLQQMRHLKLWFAVQSANWGLADYELDELKEGFEDITKYYPVKDDVPTGTMAEAILAKEVVDLAKAIEGKDKRAVTSAFDRLTASCNACHQASKKDFIRIQRPAGNPYTNQSFAPARK
jgi:cytochrome c553